MKRLLAYFLIAAVAAVAGWFARQGLSLPAADSHEEARTEDEKSEGLVVEQGLVKLTPELEERLGIVTNPLAGAEWREGSDAIGAVLDPAPFVALVQDIAAATATLQAAQVELDRASSLVQTGQNVARKSVDTSQAQVRSEQLKLAALHTRVRLEWGSLCEGLTDTALQKLMEELVSRKCALVRVEMSEGLEMPGEISEAEVLALGKQIAAKRISAAPAVNERTRAFAFLLLCDTSAQALPGGASVTARLLFGGTPQKGVDVPRDSVIRQGFQTWAFVEEEHHEYLRVPLSLTRRTASGWFVPSGEKLKPGVRVVTSGAAALLSAELVSAGFGATEEE